MSLTTGRHGDQQLDPPDDSVNAPLYHGLQLGLIGCCLIVLVSTNVVLCRHARNTEKWLRRPRAANGSRLSSISDTTSSSSSTSVVLAYESVYNFDGSAETLVETAEKYHRRAVPFRIKSGILQQV